MGKYTLLGVPDTVTDEQFEALYKMFKGAQSGQPETEPMWSVALNSALGWVTLYDERTAVKVYGALIDKWEAKQSRRAKFLPYVNLGVQQHGR